MRKIGYKYSEAEIEAMDNKFIADMLELESMPCPADTPYETMSRNTTDTGAKEADTEKRHLPKREHMRFVRKNFQKEWEAVLDAIDAYIDGACNALEDNCGASPDDYRHVAHELAQDIIKYVDSFNDKNYMPIP